MGHLVHCLGWLQAVQALAYACDAKKEEAVQVLLDAGVPAVVTTVVMCGFALRPSARA